MTVPGNALPPPHHPEAALRVEAEAGGVVLQNGGVQCPVTLFFRLFAEGRQQAGAETSAPELLADVDAHLGHAPVAPAGVYPPQCGPTGQLAAVQNDEAAFFDVKGIPRRVGRAGGLEGGVLRGDAL